VFLSAIFYGCSTHIISLSILEPAKETIPASVKSISIYPVAGLPDGPGVFDSVRYFALDPRYDYNVTKMGYIYGIYEAIASSPRFQKVLITDSVFTSSISTGIISRDLLKEICIHDSTDAVLLLKKVVAYDEKGYFIDGEYKPDSYDIKGKVTFNSDIGQYEVVRSYNSCFFFYRLISHISWALYQPELQVRPTINTSIDTVDYYKEGYFGKSYSYKTVQELLYNACFFTGNKIGKYLAPVWNNDVKRTLYSGVNEHLRSASKFVQTNKWEEAGEIWNALSENQNKRLAAKASFNIALAWERDDDLNQAFSWAGYADSLYSTHKILAYKKILEERLQQRTVLENQMNGD
jgi:hypothetical protein